MVFHRCPRRAGDSFAFSASSESGSGSLFTIACLDEKISSSLSVCCFSDNGDKNNKLESLLELCTK